MQRARDTTVPPQRQKVARSSRTRFGRAVPVSALPSRNAPETACTCEGGCPRCKGDVPGRQASHPTGRGDDRCEQEADRVAHQVMRKPATSGNGTEVRALSGRMGGPMPGAGGVPQHVDGVLRSPGEPLEPEVRRFMEARFGLDFEHVRVHRNARAGASAAAMDARAYTVGSNIVFDRGAYTPATPRGRQLLAHELAHVVQQTARGAVAVQCQRRQRGAGYREATLRVRWSDDEAEFYRRLVRAAARSAAFRGVAASAMWQPFQQPSRQFHRYYRRRHDPSAGERVRVQVQAHYDPAAHFSAVTDVRVRSPQTEVPRERAVEQAEPTPLDPTGELIAGLLRQAGAAGWEQAHADFVVAQGGVQFQQWSPHGEQGDPRRPEDARAAVRTTMDLARLSQGAEPKLYTAAFRLTEDGWTLHSFTLLASVRPAPSGEPTRRGGGAAQAGDEAERIIEDVRGTRQMVLSTAAMLIAEQDPTRLENLVFSVGPFAIGRISRLGRLRKLARMGRLSRIFGRSGRAVFGEIRFRGLVQNRPLRELSHQEIYQAFRTTPFTPSNHAISRFKDIRTSNLGVDSLNDVARHLNRGVIEDAGEGLISVRHQRFETIVNPETGIIVTFKPI